LELYHGGVDAGEFLFVLDSKNARNDFISLNYLEWSAFHHNSQLPARESPLSTTADKSARKLNSIKCLTAMIHNPQLNCHVGSIPIARSNLDSSQ